jgi:hypothetical protein
VDARQRKNAVKNANKKKVIGVITINHSDTINTVILEWWHQQLHVSILIVLNRVMLSVMKAF